MKRLGYWFLMFGVISLLACAASPEFEDDWEESGTQTKTTEASDTNFQPQYPTRKDGENVISPEANMNKMMQMMQQQMQQSMMNQNMGRIGSKSTSGGGMGSKSPGGGGIGNMGGGAF